MAEQPGLCVHCREPGTNTPDDYLICVNCGSTAPDVAAWNRRVPSPATAAMIEWIRTSNRELSFGPPADLTNAFLAEWLNPAMPPAPEQPAPASPWRCAICGDPVRIGDSLRPYHLAGPTYHEAELSSEDLKTLADGLRLTD